MFEELIFGWPGPVARSDACPTDTQEVMGSILQSGNILFDIISTAILSLPLIQVG